MVNFIRLSAKPRGELIFYPATHRDELGNKYIVFCEKCTRTVSRRIPLDII